MTDFRFKGKRGRKPTGSRTHCCHLCRTSLKIFPRYFIDCTTCDNIVCINCINRKLKFQFRKLNQSNWSCSHCCNMCINTRCTKNKSQKRSNCQYKHNMRKLKIKNKFSIEIIDINLICNRIDYLIKCYEFNLLQIRHDENANIYQYNLLTMKKFLDTLINERKSL